MSVKLKVLHGALKKHGKWQVVVPIKRSPFVIGQAADCDMRCFGRTINDHHCKIRISSTGVFISDLGSKSGTFVNGGKLDEERPFAAGDRLRLGRLAFELLVDLPDGSNGQDAFDTYISQMLLDADEIEREKRANSLEHRWYQIEPAQPAEEVAEAADPYEGMSLKERLIAKARTKIPAKQSAPMRLPRDVAPKGPRKSLEGNIEQYYQDLKAQLRS